MILSTVPGAGILPAWGDTVVTYASGVLTGDNYVGGLSSPPSSLSQDMISVNQDFLVNAGEAMLPTMIAGTLGTGGLALEAVTPIPGDAIVYETGAILAFQVTDAITSAALALYDYGRYEGDFQNHLTVGVSQEAGTMLVYWP